MKLFGIQFAPINIPFKRRLETFAVAAWIITFVFGGFIGMIIIIYLLLYTKLWWITLIYLAWVWVIDKNTPENGGRKIEWVRSWSWWKYFKDYFPLNLEKVPGVELDKNKNYLFCYFPHGVLTTGAFNAFGSSSSGFNHFFPYHEPYTVTLSLHYKIPFVRELALALGGCSASVKSIDKILSHPGGGKVCVLIVGGVPEAQSCKPGKYNLVLNRRKGFVKLALKNGSPLVPVLSFGETDLYSEIKCFQRFIHRFTGFAPVIPLGRGLFQYSFGIIPYRKPVTTVVGMPLDIEKIENPSREKVDEVHKEFVDALTALFEEQKYQYLTEPENVHLEII